MIVDAAGLDDDEVVLEAGGKGSILGPPSLPLFRVFIGTCAEGVINQVTGEAG